MSYSTFGTLASPELGDHGYEPSGLCSLEADEVLIIRAVHTLSDVDLRITRSPKRPKDGFVVERVLETEEIGVPVILKDGAADWDLKTEGKLLTPTGSVNGLLLGPSLLGPSLYGGDLPTDPANFRSRFGIIAPRVDPRDGAWELHISMPDGPYLGMGRISLMEIA